MLITRIRLSNSSANFASARDPDVGNVQADALQRLHQRALSGVQRSIRHLIRGTDSNTDAFVGSADHQSEVPQILDVDAQGQSVRDVGGSSFRLAVGGLCQRAGRSLPRWRRCGCLVARPARGRGGRGGGGDKRRFDTLKHLNDSGRPLRAFPLVEIQASRRVSQS